MAIIEIAEAVQYVTQDRIEFDHACWIALALEQQEAGTYNADDWMFVPELRFSVLRAEYERTPAAQEARDAE